MRGKLFIVPTPVGNMGDMTPRAVDTLKDVSLILCEDTRTSAPLLRHFGIDTPTASHHKFNEHDTAAPIAERIVAGENIALISDAGTPGISDPGFMLVRECRRLGVDVETLPGATALIPALVNSGLPCDRFTFEGFLPPKKGRATRLAEIASEAKTVIIYESPLRLMKTLSELAGACGGDRQASVSREISKMYNTTACGTLAELLQYFEMNPPKGEIVIVLDGNHAKKQKSPHKNKYRNCEPGE
ncbi:MAG: 16S rRNA (cytidine(1402)-2'-O)-methyltransferase [Muribaculum sp.]|nr:16S rRNA (cytidine(1402)-2'-O)-methyltransferase [Muribaculaceae bacterium]MCM1080555.1 16S rRNA (cytidine(1402)-2'-O)-methyltransferase [Muribaculum sp.]